MVLLDYFNRIGNARGVAPARRRPTGEFEMHKTLFAAAGALALTGCLSASDPAPIQPFGSVSLASVPATGGASTRPFARFFRARRNQVRVVNSRQVTNTCTVGGYSAGGGTPAEQFGDLSAGSALALTIGAVQVSVPQRPVGAVSYNYQTTAPITFTPGDSARISVPGETGQFPAATLAVKTAEAFVVDPVAVPAVGDNLDVRWTPPGDTSSAMLISLRYADEGSTTLNQQIFCDVFDLGQITIESNLLGGWANAESGLREVAASRVRTDQTGSDDGYLLHVLSSYDTRGTVAEP
jgi:hypothetical protein